MLLGGGKDETKKQAIGDHVSVRVVPRSKQDSDSINTTNVAVELNRETLQSMFHMRLPEAAKRLGVSETTLKQVCRKLGVPRWPRQLKYPTTSNAVGGAATKAGARRADSPLSASHSEESNDEDDELKATKPPPPPEPEPGSRSTYQQPRSSLQCQGLPIGSSINGVPILNSLTMPQFHEPRSVGPAYAQQFQFSCANFSTLAPMSNASSLTPHTRLSAQFESELASIISFPPLSDLLRDGAGRDAYHVGAGGMPRENGSSRHFSKGLKESTLELQLRPKDSVFRQSDDVQRPSSSTEASVRVVPRSMQGGLKANVAVELNREKLQSMFHMRLPEAAKRLGVSETTLKQVCRKLGVPRWPRQLKYPTPSNAGVGDGAATQAGARRVESPLSTSFSEESNVGDDTRDSGEAHVTASETRKLSVGDKIADPHSNAHLLDDHGKPHQLPTAIPTYDQVQSEIAAFIAFPALSELLGDR
jgi:predicted DNA-binding protein (UPF0251 family)